MSNGHDQQEGFAVAAKHPAFLTVFPSIMLPMFLAVVDQTIVATALPAIAAATGDVGRASWIVVSYLIAVAREKGVSAYVGDGSNRWSAVHRLDAARLYRLAFEKTASDKNAGVARYHAVGEEGVPAKEIAEAIGRGLKMPVVAVAPEQAVEHFGFLGNFAGLDMPASSALTQKRLGWGPIGPGLIRDLEAMKFDA